MNSLLVAESCYGIHVPQVVLTAISPMEQRGTGVFVFVSQTVDPREVFASSCSSRDIAVYLLFIDS